MSYKLNQRAFQLVERMAGLADELRIESQRLPGGGRVLDFGVHVPGSLKAGLGLADVCLSGLGEVATNPGGIEDIAWPYVSVRTDAPVAACLLSQYAGWQISVEKFFAMGSGPMRAVAAVEELFDKLQYKETSDCCIGVLESSQLPDDAVFDFLSEKIGLSPEKITLLVAPTSSIAGNFQVVARSVETALHKLFELEFDVHRVAAGFGTAPLSPVAADDLTGIGRTNDAILYGGKVTLWVNGDDETLAEVGPKIPANASECYGKPFLKIFEEAGRDFYQIDPHLFSPAEIVLQNLDTGKVHHFGKTAPDVLRKSFGL